MSPFKGLIHTDNRKMNNRKSNIELLRIISMLMVLAVHADGAALGLPQLWGDLSSVTTYDLWRLAIESVAIIGVNCFTLISGYFGIKFQWRGIAAFLFECAFYSVGIYTAAALIYPDIFSWRCWVESCLVLTHTDLWYIPAYFALMFLSPVLNAGMSTLNRRQATIVLGLFLIFNVWCGWWWQGEFNPTGYTLVQLILVYMIGRYLSIHVDSTLVHNKRNILVTIYIVSTLCIFMTSVFMDSLQAFAYNSPFVLLSTISLFLIFTTLKIRSKIINYTARSAFAAYLIHKAPLVWGNIMKPCVIWLETSLPGWAFLIAVCGVIIGFYLIAMAIDPVRRSLSRAVLGR